MEKYLVISERQKDLPTGLNSYCYSHLILHNYFPGILHKFLRIFFFLKHAKSFFFFAASDVFLLLTHTIL